MEMRIAALNVGVCDNIVASTTGGSMANVTTRKIANKLRENVGNIQQFEPEILQCEAVRHPNAIIREEIEHLARQDADQIQ